MQRQNLAQARPQELTAALEQIRDLSCQLARGLKYPAAAGRIRLSFLW